MNIFKRIRIKLNTVLDYYLFNYAGIPKVRRENISKKVFKKYLPSNPVMIDCGAHDGADSVELIRIFGGSLHAFEPVPTIFARLKNKTSGYRNIHCYNVALSDQNGKQSFYLSGGESDASSSLLQPLEHLVDHPDTDFSDKIEVQAITLDDWATQNNIQRIDMLWLDMQGFELNMLEASHKILNTVRVIHTEVSTKETYKGVSLYREYRKFLEGKGFSVILEAIPEGWDMGNVLFVRKGDHP